MSILSKLLEGFKSLVLGPSVGTPDDGRDSPRILCQYRVNLQSSGREFKGSVVDIGTTGMRILDVPKLEKGEILKVSYPFAEAFQEDHSFDVVVMWCRESAGQLEAGTRFVKQGEELKGTWVHLLLSELGLTGDAHFQKRQYVRMASIMEVAFRDPDTGRHLLTGKLNNISVGGALVESEKSIKSGRKVFVLMGTSVNSPTFTVNAKVVNSRTDEEWGCDLISLQFVDMNKDQLNNLESLVIAMVEGRSLK